MGNLNLPYLTPSQTIHVDLPEVMRLVHLQTEEMDDGQIRNEAIVYFAGRLLNVVWLSNTVDDGLQKNYLVRLATDTATLTASGKILIEELRPANTALRSVNLFLTVPQGWVSDRHLINRAAQLWEQMDRHDAAILNETLWDSRQFYRYLTGSESPTSADRNTGLRQRVKLAERAAQLSPPEAVSAAITAALLGAEEHLIASATLINQGYQS